MDLWHIQLPTPVALAFVAAMGYLISRWRRPTSTDIVVRSRRELKRAQAVALELEKIAWTVRQSLAKHHASVSRFKDRVSKLGDQQQDAAGKELCREAEDILRPTLQLATQIANAYDEIRQQTSHLMTFTEVRTDPLTGVNNRRGLDDALNSHLAIMSRYSSVFSLAMFDIDHFKQVNDREGHLHGDRVLQELARLFDECVRETDIVGRYGGEEFVVIMPHTDLAGACGFAERLRREVATRLGITISGGLAAAQEGDAADAIIARADAALYCAKSAGRNRVFYHTGDESRPVAVDELVPAAT
jgi:diguanylate cyclase (GGDEF)-like protein